MTQASRYALAALLLAVGATTIVPATAQFAPEPADNVTPADAPKAKKPPPAARVGPEINGNWAGQLTQVGRETPYKFEIAITSRGLETKYPDLNCTGKLTRIGQSKSYVFFVEVITQGQAEKGGNCPDG